MIRYIAASVISGILFGIMDGVINANPLARRLYEVYKPIARQSIDPVSGMIIDLLFGFVLAGIFFILYKSLPGKSGLVKGLSFACMVWFLRVAMYTASQWMMFNMPSETVFYSLVTGLAEAAVLGVIFGLMLKPA